jgi:hypothetical protein
MLFQFSEHYGCKKSRIPCTEQIAIEDIAPANTVTLVSRYALKLKTKYFGQIACYIYGN